MTPDISLLFLIGLVSAINGGVLLWAMLLGAERRVIGPFAAGCLALALSMATPLLVADNQSPWWATGFNVLPMLSYTLWLVGVLNLVGQPRHARWAFLLMLLILLPVLWFTFVDPQRTPRVALVAGSLAALRLVSAIMLLRAGKHVDRRVAWVFAAVLLVECLTMVNRTVSAWSGVVPPIGGDAAQASVITWITMLSSALLSTPLLLLLALGRMVGDLRHTASRLDATLGAMPDAVIELDEQGRLRSLRSRDPEQLPFPIPIPARSDIGRPLAALLPDRHGPSLRQLLDEARSGRGVLQIQISGQGESGPRWFGLSAAALPSSGAAGSAGFVLVSRDVTAREQAAQALRYRNTLLQHLLADSPIGLLLSELESGRLIEANPAFLSQTGMAAEAVPGVRYAALFAADSSVQHAELLGELRARGESGPLTTRWVRADGSEMDIRLTAFALDDPDAGRLVWSIIEDVSEQQRVQRAKSELVAVVSHELRTPLTALLGAVGLVAGTQGDQLDPQSRKLIRIALDNGQRLRELVDDLLDLDRLVAGRLNFELVRQPLQPLLAQAVSANTTYSGSAGVGIQLQPAPADAEVEVDGGRLVQVLGNLLSNAIKFSPAGSAVELNVVSDGGHWLIRVRDHGPGVPDAFVPRLFDRFAQADASDTRQRGGSGLGLAIAREMIERMRGSVAYQPADGGGACFLLRLPLCTPRPSG